MRVVPESAHALTAYLFKVPFVLSHLYFEIDRAAATMNERAVIGLAGPLSCLEIQKAAGNSRGFSSDL